jgi:hypothetical protein
MCAERHLGFTEGRVFAAHQAELGSFPPKLGRISGTQSSRSKAPTPLSNQQSLRISGQFGLTHDEGHRYHL